MNQLKNLIIPVMMCITFSASLQAQKTFRLWENTAPGALGTDDEDIPTLAWYPAPAEHSVGSAVIICPGGGYVFLSMDHEGKQVAEWLNSLGVSAFVLKYRIHSSEAKPYMYPVQFNDATRAMRLVRSRAKEFGLDAHKIGIMGFSAGGHLASTVGTHFDDGNAQSTDLVEKSSSRPDFMVLCYPVISMVSKFTHQGSRNALLGNNPKPELAKFLSGELQVTPKTPPCFLFHTNADEAVPAENSVEFYLALRRAKVPAEIHIYQDGPHGVGLDTANPVLTTWKERLRDWLQVNHWAK